MRDAGHREASYSKSDPPIIARFPDVTMGAWFYGMDQLDLGSATATEFPQNSQHIK